MNAKLPPNSSDVVVRLYVGAGAGPCAQARTARRSSRSSRAPARGRCRPSVGPKLACIRKRAASSAVGACQAVAPESDAGARRRRGSPAGSTSRRRRRPGQSHRAAEQGRRACASSMPRTSSLSSFCYSADASERGAVAHPKHLYKQKRRVTPSTGHRRLLSNPQSSGRIRGRVIDAGIRGGARIAVAATFGIVAGHSKGASMNPQQSPSSRMANRRMDFRPSAKSGPNTSRRRSKLRSRSTTPKSNDSRPQTDAPIVRQHDCGL